MAKNQSKTRHNIHFLTAIVAVVAIVAIVVIWNGSGAALTLPEQAKAGKGAETPAGERAQAQVPSAAQDRGKVLASRTFVTKGVHTTGGTTQIVFDTDETGLTTIIEVTSPTGRAKGTVCVAGACR